MLLTFFVAASGNIAWGARPGSGHCHPSHPSCTSTQNTHSQHQIPRLTRAKCKAASSSSGLGGQGAGTAQHAKRTNSANSSSLQYSALQVSACCCKVHNQLCCCRGWEWWSVLSMMRQLFKRCANATVLLASCLGCSPQALMLCKTLNTKIIFLRPTSSAL